MAKWAHADFLDGGFVAFKAAVNKLILLKAYTAGDSYATVNTTNNIGEVAVASGDFTVGSSGADRVMTSATKSAPATANSGATPNLHFAFVDTVNSKVLWVTDETSDQVITAGNTLNFPALSFTAAQPT